MIKEFCLVPQTIINNLKLNQTNQNVEDKIRVIDKKTSFLPYTDPSEYRIDLKDQLRSTLKTKFDRGYALYLWLKENEKHLEYLKNGDMITPISNINLISFINNSVSKTKSISQDNLDKYKSFVNMVNLPEYFIENTKLKEYLFPNAVSFKKDSNKTGKINKRTLPVNKDINNDNDNTYTNDNTSTINLRSQSKKRKVAGNIHYSTTINPMKSFSKSKERKSKWIKY